MFKYIFVPFSLKIKTKQKKKQNDLLQLIRSVFNPQTCYTCLTYAYQIVDSESHLPRVQTVIHCHQCEQNMISICLISKYV